MVRKQRTRTYFSSRSRISVKGPFLIVDSCAWEGPRWSLATKDSFAAKPSSREVVPSSNCDSPRLNVQASLLRDKASKLSMHPRVRTPQFLPPDEHFRPARSMQSASPSRNDQQEAYRIANRHGPLAHSPQQCRASICGVFWGR